MTLNDSRLIQQANNTPSIMWDSITDLMPQASCQQVRDELASVRASKYHLDEGDDI